MDAGVAPGGPTAERGAEVFRLNCALCHGPDGSGGAIYPQSIRGRTGIADQVHHGGNGMPAFPLMSDVDIASVELFLAGAAPPPPDPDAGAGGAGGGMDAGAPGDPRVAAGAALFRQNCAICHGPDGSGGPVWARSIRNMTGIAVQVRNGGGGMPAFPAMTDEQITAIELFLSDAQAPPPADAGPPPPPPTGREVFALVCASCHGDDGEGTANGPQIESPVVGYATWVVRNGRARTRYPNPMVAYPEAAVSADQLTEILTWLRSFPKPQTGEGLYTRFCGNCHGPQGRGGRTEGIGGNLGDIRERVRRGHGGSNYASEYMPAWGPDELSDNDLALIAQYLSTFGRGGD
jgi:mono/diheme cytochrome c family protein